MTYFPIQYFGLGDVIFTQTLIKEIAKGDTVVWGVMPMFVDGLNRAYPDIQFVDYKALNIDYNRKEPYYPIPDSITIPIRFSDSYMRQGYANVMKNKYEMYGKNWETWRNTMFCRNNVREFELFCLLGLKMGEPYNLIHQDFGSDVKFHRPIVVDNGLKNAHVKLVDGFSLFDWAYVYENATNIHAVSSSNVYIMELLNLQAKEIHLYKRDRLINGKPYSEPHTHYDYILQRHKYILE